MSDDIVERIADAMPLEKGDRTLIASDVRQMCRFLRLDKLTDELHHFIDLLKEKVGEEGTLLFPTYNWNFCKGIPFDYKKTRSRTGSLSQMALKRDDFTRTHHALYSFAVWGKGTERLYNMNDANSFVGDTPFDWLYRNNGKMIMLDVTPNRCFTFIHYCEETNHVDYRFVKEFHGKYIDEWDQESERMYSMFVRYLDERNVTLHPDTYDWFRSSGVLKETKVEGIPVGCMLFTESFDFMTQDIQHNDARHLIVRAGSNIGGDG